MSTSNNSTSRNNNKSSSKETSSNNKNLKQDDDEQGVTTDSTASPTKKSDSILKKLSNDKDNDSASSASSSSSENKLKIDIEDDYENKSLSPSKSSANKTKNSDETTTKSSNTSPKKSAKSFPQKSDKSTENEKSKMMASKMDNDDANNSSQASTTSSRQTNSGRKRPINRGLDGGYWSTIPVDLSDKRKRRRTTVERLDISLISNSTKANMSGDDSMTNFTDNESQINFQNDENSQHSESTSSTTSKTTKSSNKKRYILFRSKTFITVRNESGGFFLCQTVNKIYDDSKRCRIQWLEEIGQNKYKFGYVDSVDTFAIICKVNVRRVSSRSTSAGSEGGSQTLTGCYEIYEEDLKKVNDLLEKALKDGGITVDFESGESEESDDEEDASKSASKFMEDDEFFDKEEEEGDQEKSTKKPIKKDENLKNNKNVTDSSESKRNDNLNVPLKKRLIKKNLDESDDANQTQSDAAENSSQSELAKPKLKKKKFKTDTTPSNKSKSDSSSKRSKLKDDRDDEQDAGDEDDENENKKKSNKKHLANPYKFTDNDVAPTISTNLNDKKKVSSIGSTGKPTSNKSANDSINTTPKQAEAKNINQSKSSIQIVKKSKIQNEPSSSKSKKSDSEDEDEDDDEEKDLKTPSSSSKISSNSANKKVSKEQDSASKKQKPVQKKAQNKKTESDTEELESEDEETDASKSNKKLSSNKKKQQIAKETINPKKIPTNSPTRVKPSTAVTSTANSANNNSTKPVTDVGSNANVVSKKKRLFKVVSNRYLDTNTKVNVFAKDPFFEDENETMSSIPFISPLVQSKFAFKAIHLGDLKLLRKLIDDVDNIPSVHVGRSVYNTWIPAEYALYLENKEALEMLIDNYLSETKDGSKRVEMPETMVQRFTTGVYNPRSLGVQFVRKLTESRGVKEGNNAFIKDSNTLTLCQSRRRRCYDSDEFFKRLFNVALEHGSSNDLLDLIIAKHNSLNSSANSYYNNQNRNLYENIIKAICFGNRKLAAHILENAPPGYGFNVVHLEVLKADNDADLKCQLRANMCTKKPFANDLVTPIHCACINPNVKYLKTLLSITQDLNIADKRGRKPVHYAAVCEGLSPLEYLISRVSPYELDSFGSTPLHYACLAGRTVNVEMLLSHARLKQEDDSTITSEIVMDNKYGLGGINKPNRRGLLPLHLAISRNNYDCVKVLIKYDCNVEYPLPNSMGKMTPLMYACQLGHHKIVQLLIESNSKIEARDRFQRTAAIHAAMCGHARTLSYLLRLGANPNVCDSSGNSCLHYACAYGWYFCMKTLLEAGAIVNVFNDWKLTPFGAAFLKGHVGICDQLLVLHPNQIDINFRTEDGETLVMLAVSSTNLFNQASVNQLDYIVNKLGGNTHLVDSKGANAFHYLASNSIDRNAIEEQVRLLFQGEDSTSLNALETEIKKKVEQKYQEQEEFRKKMADILLKAKCNPNAANNELETPLFSSIISSNYSFARYLLKSKEINAPICSSQNASGNTILSLMAEKCFSLDGLGVILGEKYEDLEILNKYRGEFEKMALIKDEKGLTPFQIAFIRIREQLDANSSKSDFKIPEHTIEFIKFLYKECKSNPNSIISFGDSSTNNSKAYFGLDESKIKNDEETENEENSKDDDDDDDSTSDEDSNNKSNAKNYFTPIFELIDDRSIDLIDSLVKLMNDKQLNLIKINFNFYDKQGLTPLLKSIVARKSKFSIKLIDLGVYTAVDLFNQIAKNSNKYLNENLLQLAVRFGQFDLFERVIDFIIDANLAPSESINFVNFLTHQNIYKQNFMHLLASLGSSERVLFNSYSWCSLLAKISNYIAAIPSLASIYSQKNTILNKLIILKDKLDRNPLHLCLLNYDSKRSDIQLEMFFLEHFFNINKSSSLSSPATSDASKEIKQQIFLDKDLFNRLPLHYLFFDSINFETLSFKSNHLYKVTDLAKLIKSNSVIKSVYFGPNEISVIDPVEILTILIKQMDNKSLDDKDLFGYTPLHYAAIRGSTISCSLLISHDCNMLSRCLNPFDKNDEKNLQKKSDPIDGVGNTPLSSSIYFKRETCVLTLLRSILENNTKKIQGEKDLRYTLKDYYYLHEKDYVKYNPDYLDDQGENSSSNFFNSNSDSTMTSEPNLVWLHNVEKDLYPIKSIPLYKLILMHNWEGISWLVLGELDNYGLTQFDAINSALIANEFSLCLRLIEKYDRQEDNKILLKRTLFQPNAEHSRTLLHVIANLSFKNSNDVETLKNLLKKLLSFNSNNESLISSHNSLVYDFVTRKDSFGSTAFHYACYLHNFEFIDFMINYFISLNTNTKSESLIKPHSLFTCKDSDLQTAYSLLYWQIGRVSYTQEVQDKIKYYTNHYLNLSNTESVNGVASGGSGGSVSNLESLSKAYFSLVSASSFDDLEPKQKLIKDYPREKKQANAEMISPLIYAINRQDFTTCKFLIKELNFNINTMDSNDTNALVYAIRTNNVRLCHLLLNVDFEADFGLNRFKNDNSTKSKLDKSVVESRMKNLFQEAIKSKSENEENASDFSEEEFNEADESLNEENSAQRDDTNAYNENQSSSVDTSDSLVSPSKVKVKSDIILNQIDKKSRTIFHHLASSLEFGSFHNIEIAKLFFAAFNNDSVDETQQTKTKISSVKLPILGDFLKRVDSKVLTASDYALRNGNITLYEEIQKIITKSNSIVQIDQQKLNKFVVNDSFYIGLSSKPNYINEAELFLKKYLEDHSKNDSTNSDSANKNDCFQVDPNSNMSKIGSLVWDQKQNVPYDVVLTKTDVSYGLYGMHNFYKMQLITHNFNHSGSSATTKSDNSTNQLNGHSNSAGANLNDKASNKFDENQMCVLFTRWGRIGDVGQYQRTPFSNFKEAKDEFCKIFKQKTGNDFIDTVIEKKKNFENKSRRYNLIKFEMRNRHKLKEIEFDLFNKADSNNKSSNKTNDLTALFDKSKFKINPYANDYKEFFTDLLDVEYLKSQINSTPFSAEFLPLAQLSRESIDKACDILNKKLKPLIERRMELEKLNKKENLTEYMNLLDQINKFSNEYYELIPQMNYNYEKLVPVSSEKDLDEQLCIMNKLSNSQIAIRILMGAKYSMLQNPDLNNPFNYVYYSINAKLERLDQSQPETQYVLRYICPYSNKKSNYKIKRIFKFERLGEQERFDKVKLSSNSSKLKNRYLLWHGTGTENVMSILCKGLLKAPNDAKWNGQRFGKGIYFSDSFEASSSYSTGRSNKNKSWSEQTSDRKYMLLCEVALGKVKEIRTFHETLESLPSGYDSVKALGKNEPNTNGDVIIPNGAIIPLGERVYSKLKPGEYRRLEHTQYVVYDEAQVCIRYIVQYYE